MNNDLIFIREICEALEDDEDKFLDYNDLYILDKLLKIDAVRYILRKEKKSKVDDPYLEEVYENMDEDEREEIRKIVLKNIKIRNRTKAKIEREKKQKEYLRQQEKISKDRKSRDITKKIKALFAEELLDKNKEHIDRKINSISNIISQNTEKTTMNTNREALLHLKKNNFFRYELNKEFKCVFFDSNMAWISKKPKSGEVRYFSKNTETKEFFYLDIINIIEILYDCSFAYGFLKTMKILNIATREEEWKEVEREKYRHNIEVTEFAELKMQVEYPLLYCLIKKQLPILDRLNNIGQARIVTMEESVEGDAIFFSSYNYIAKYLSLSKSYIEKCINIFVLLELIIKVPEEKIPKYLLNRANEEAQKRGWNKINFYTIPLWNNTVLRNAENMARKLRFSKISTSSISIKKVREVFGEEIVNKVYENTKENVEKIAQIKDIKKQYSKQVTENIENIEDETILLFSFIFFH